ncbi:uncharacterized protein [Physcomitrium patens]|uniref:uncharacterized protein n=1 Tax=Physcomitrium patens TaxID=3218 RepID=UPI003CCDE86C
MSRRFLGHFQAGASEVNESDSILAEGCRESCMEQCEMGTENCTAVRVKRTFAKIVLCAAGSERIRQHRGGRLGRSVFQFGAE